MVNGSGFAILFLKEQTSTKRVICCALFLGDPVNLLNEQAIQGSGINEFTDHDQNNESVWQAMANNSLPSSSSLVSFRRGLPSLLKTGGLDPSKSIYRLLQFTSCSWPGNIHILHQSATREGQIVKVQEADVADTKKIIPDLEVRPQCFGLYVTALTPPPNRLQNLMAYQLFIAKCSLKYWWPSWVVYDQNFCLEVANQPDYLWA